MMAIHIHPLERKWLFVIAVIILLTWVIQLYYALNKSTHPPSNVEVIDSVRLHLNDGIGGGEFAETNLGVKRDKNGQLRVTMVAARYSFYPQEIVLPLGESITFRFASFDVLHGLHVPFSNLNSMVVPGYISEVTTEFTREGEFPILCNEYCGTAHAFMYGKIKIVAKEKFKL